VSETLVDFGKAMPKPADWTSDDWATPVEIVREFEAEFGPFDLDACCRTDTAKAPTYYTKADNSLAQPWFGRVWMNPPFSNPEPWLKKAIAETEAGRAEMVVALLPASTDTAWFHEHVLGKAEVRFRRGRIKFIGWRGTPIGSPKGGTVFAIYRRPTC
jgi:phage N-6-adenine-methyltransferase